MKRVFGLLILLCFPVFYAAAQSTAQVSGTVLDPSGASIAGAQVQITNTDTNAVRTTQSSDDGSYSFPNLPIGPYKLTASKSGFETFIQSGIVLQVSTNPTVNVTLNVGAVAQTVEVQANAAMVETQSNSGLGQVIQPEQVVDLPLNGRQATQLIALSGAAVNTAGAGGIVNNLDYPTAVSFSVAGSQGNATNYFLDGAINMDFRTNVGLPLPFPDALQEFKVESNSLPADTGSHPGGSVNAAVKSGTNSFHGDAFDYLRNTVMDAYPERFIQSNGKISPTTPIPDNLKRNQFGGIIGGPIIKDKLFFFYGYQGTRERVLGTATTVHVPTAATLNGDFTAMLAPPCQAKQVFLNSNFTTAPNSNIIQPALLATPSALVAKRLSAYLPTPTDACGTASYNPFTSDDENQSVIRGDWQRTQNDTIFIHYFVTNYTLLPNFVNNDILTAGAPGLSDRAQSVDIGDTHIINPLLISSLRLSFARTGTVRTSPNGIPTWSQLGANVTSQVANYTGQNSVSGYFTPTDPAFPGYDYENIFGISETIGWTRGAHQMTFGATGMHVQMNNDGLFQVNANFTFGGTVTGNALADFLTGNPSKLSQGNGQLGRDSQNIPSMFFQDNWKISRHFQINAGLRWDPFIPQYTKYKQASDFSLANYDAGKISSVYPNAPPGVTFPGDYGFNEKSDTKARIWDFSPRLGFVWDPRGDGRSTVRGGYGMFYDTSVLWNTMHIVLNPPWGLTLGFTPETVAQGGGLANPWAGQAGGNPFPSPLNPPSSFVFPQNGTYVFEDQNIKPSNVQQWNVSLQKQLGTNWLVSASYLGSKTTHQWLGQNLNTSTLISPSMVGSVPGVISATPVAGQAFGVTGSCVLAYEGAQINWPVCNGLTTETATVTLPGQSTPTTITNEAARKAAVLTNPTAGPLFGGGLTEDFSNGNATYNGLLVSAQHRLSQHFSVLTNFTWSHCEDQGEIGQDITNAFQNPSNRKGEWGNCAADRRRIFNLSLVALSPKYHDRVMEAVVGNWQASGIFTASSGSYLNVTDGGDLSFSGVGSDRPVEVGNPFAAGTIAGNPGCTGPTNVKLVTSWFNPCAFTAQPYQTFGTLGRDSLLGPGNWNFDAAIWRTFPITERFKLDFRAEAFNAFNHLQIGNPGTGVYSTFTECITTTPSTPTCSPSTPVFTLTRSTSTGLITSAANNPRIMQLALKLTF
jgi:hypothetical protein